jgi:argininosuccinate lyase
MFCRDFERIFDAQKRVQVSPLGAAALAGTTYPLNPRMVADELGLGGIFLNSMDAVSDRDFVLEALFIGATIMIHLSRMCEEIILWANPGFGFIYLPDAFATGSSIMPQKKNPDVAEIMRGKTGRATGNLISLLTTLKGLPLTYNRDLQEDTRGKAGNVPVTCHGSGGGKHTLQAQRSWRNPCGQARLFQYLMA